MVICARFGLHFQSLLSYPSKPAGLLTGQNWNLELSQGITLILSNVFSFTLSIFCLPSFSYVNYLSLTYQLNIVHKGN